MRDLRSRRIEPGVVALTPIFFFYSLRMGDSNVAITMALTECLGPHVGRELSKQSLNFSVQRSTKGSSNFAHRLQKAKVKGHAGS